MKDEIAQIAATAGILYGLSRKGTVYTLTLEDGVGTWVPLAESPRIVYGPKPKPQGGEAHV